MAGEAASAGLLYFAKTLKVEESLTSGEVLELTSLLNAILPENHHHEVAEELVSP